MIDADLAVVAAAEMVTAAGRAPRRGRDLAAAGVVPGGCLAARDGVLVFVGDEREYRRQVRLDRRGVEIDASGRTVLPGFVDAHTHLPFAGSREDELAARLAGATYEEIAARGGGIMKTVAATRAASLDALVALAKPRLDRMLLHGTTTAEAKSGYGLALEHEIKQLRAIRALDAIHPIDLVATFLGAHVVPGGPGADRAAYVAEVRDRMIPAVAAERLAVFCDVFVDRNGFTAGEAEAIFENARRHGLRPRVHADQRGACGGAELAARVRAASADHLEAISEAGVAALAGGDTAAVLLPGAAFFLRETRDPPVRRLIEAAVPIVVATDFNPGTCPTEAMTAILPHACLRYGLDPAEAIVAATLNAAWSLGLEAAAGSLEVGKEADVQIVDLPSHRHLVYHFGVNHCRTVIKRGRVVVEDGRIAGAPGAVPRAGSGG